MESARKIHEYSFIKIFAAFCSAILGSVAFSTDLSVSGFSAHANITLSDNTLLWSVLSVFLMVLYLKTFQISKKSDRISLGIMSVLFGYLNVMGHSMHELDSLDFLFANAYQFMLGSMCALGYAALFFAAGTFLFAALDNKKLSEANPPKGGGCTSLIRQHPRAFAAVIIGFVLLCWLVIYYPGCTNYDINYQLRQFFGLDAWTNSHPAATTAIMGICMQIGKMIGSDNIGMFLYMLLQGTVFCLVFSAIYVSFVKLRASKGIRIFVMLFYALLPCWGAYAVQAMKDGLFAGIFSWYILETLQLFLNEDESPRLLIEWSISGLLSCLTRSAVVFMILPSMVLGALILPNRKKKKMRSLAFSAGVAALSLGFIYLLLPALGVIDCNRAESMSIPFQQTARTVRDRGDSVTEEEKQAIDAVLEYDKLAEVYMPVLSDPVKDTYKQRDLETEDRALSEYMSVWRSMMGKYPYEYIQSLMGNTYGYYSFTPSIQTTNGHTSMCYFLYCGDENGVVSNQVYTIRFSPILKSIRSLVGTLAYLVDSVPILNLLYACAFYFWSILLMFVYIRKRKSYKLLIVIMPVVLLMFGCLGSSVNDCFRYEAPVAAAFPIVILSAIIASTAQKKR